MGRNGLSQAISRFSPYYRHIVGASAIALLTILVITPRFGEIQHSLREAFTIGNLPFYMLALLGFATINWGLESEKWYRLINSQTTITRFQAFRSVLIGTAASMISPGRTGDVVGRALTLPRKRRVAVHAGVIGSLSQLLVTLFIGTAAASFFYFQGVFLEEKLLMASVVIGATGCLVVSLAYFTNIKLPFLEKRISRYRARNIGTRLKLELVFLSLGRYIIFSIQFLFALSLLGNSLPPALSISAIALVYLILAIMPALILGELGVRESVVMVVFSTLTQNWDMAIVASLMVWLVNLAIPSLVGALLIWKRDRSA